MDRPSRLWIDGIGGFHFTTDNALEIGFASPGNPVDLAVRGDLSRRAGRLERVGDEYVLVDYSASSVALTPRILGEAEEFSLGNVQFLFTRPLAASYSARLDITPPAKWGDSLQGAILAGKTCVIGSHQNAHVRCPDWDASIVIFSEDDRWFAKVLTSQVNQLVPSAPHPLVLGRRLVIEDYSICLE